jgi:DNA replication protein DnaC
MTPPAPAIDVDALLRRLHLPTVRRLYPDLAQRAEQDGLGYRDFLALLMAEEVAHRAQTRIQRCVRRAHFPFLKTIDEYDFTLQAGVRLALLGSALSPEFVTQGQTLILSGPSGTGKTHLAVALAYRAIQNGFEARFTSATALIDELSTATTKGRLGQVLPGYTHPHVLLIDEVGYLSYGPDAANVLFQVVNDRYLHHRPMIFTTNKPLGAWGRVLHDPDLAEAILDRVLERGRHLELRGPSYRTRHVQLDLHHDLRAPSGRPTRISGNQVSEFPEPTRGKRPGHPGTGSGAWSVPTAASAPCRWCGASAATSV